MISISKCMRLRVPLTLIVTILLLACGGLSGKQRAATETAIKSLRKIEAATQVGITFVPYGQLIVEAKAAVNDAVATLPNCDLRIELNATMDAYADVGQVWNAKIQNNGTLYSKYGLGLNMIPKYSLPAKKTDFGADTLGDHVEAEIAMQMIWVAAADHLKSAAAIFEENKLNDKSLRSVPKPSTAGDATTASLQLENQNRTML